MAAKRDYYEVLGVSRDADAGTIKKAYRKLAKKYHPDTNPGDKQAEKSFKEVTEAYTILSDPEKKRLYDQFGHSAFDGSGAGQNPHGNPFENAGGGYQEYHFESGNMDDIFGDMFDHIFHGRQSGGFQNSGFESGGFGKNGFYRQGFDSSQFVRKGQDLRAEVSITFEEAAFGCDKVIHLQSPDGRGSTQSLQVHIPAGIETGKSVRLRGKGMPGSNGGEKPPKWDLADYVLGHFSKEEQEQMEEGYEHAVCAVKEIVTGNIEAAMNEYNRKKKEK